MINEQKLKKDIMGRITTLYFMRLWGRPVTESVLLLGFAAAAKQLVFWQAAVFNMSHLSISEWAGYAVGAFWHTNLPVQITLVGVAVVGATLSLDLVKLIQSQLVRKFVFQH